MRARPPPSPLWPGSVLVGVVVGLDRPLGLQRPRNLPRLRFPAPSPPNSHAQARMSGLFACVRALELQSGVARGQRPCDVGGLEEAGGGRWRQRSSSYPKVARSMSRQGALANPGGLRCCPDVAEKLPTRCRTVAPGAGNRPQIRPTSADLGQDLAEFGKMLGQTLPLVVDSGQNRGNFDQHWSTIAN